MNSIEESDNYDGYEVRLRDSSLSSEGKSHGYSQEESLATGEGSVYSPDWKLLETNDLNTKFSFPFLCSRFQEITENLYADHRDSILKKIVGKGNSKIAFLLRRGKGDSADPTYELWKECCICPAPEEKIPAYGCAWWTQQEYWRKRITDSLDKRVRTRKSSPEILNQWIQFQGGQTAAVGSLLREELSVLFRKKRMILLLPKDLLSSGSLRNELRRHEKLIEAIAKRENSLEDSYAIQHLAVPIPRQLSKDFMMGSIPYDSQQSVETDSTQASQAFFDVVDLMKCSSTPLYLVEKREGDLDEWKNRLSWKEKIEVFLDILKGLKFLNTSLGFLHRDVSARNVLIQHNPFDGRVHGFLTDFGLTSEIGTIPSRMPLWEVAPEQIVRERWENVRSDLFSFGLMVLRTLRSATAFEALKAEELHQIFVIDYEKGLLPMTIETEMGALEEDLVRGGIAKESRALLLQSIRKALRVNPFERIDHDELIAVFSQLSQSFQKQSL